MARSFCERCNMDKPTSKGGFCPFCMTHTGTYYADRPRNDVVSTGGINTTTIEPVASIVYAPREPHKKKDKNLFKDKSKRVKKSRGAFAHNRSQWGSSWGTSQIRKKKVDMPALPDSNNNSRAQSANEHTGNFSCDNCGKIFSNQNELEEHVAARKFR